MQRTGLHMHMQGSEGMQTILWTPATVAMKYTRWATETSTAAGLTAAAIGKSANS
jgi:hypothetical protein